jgi:signal transduction histidine kinase
MEQTWELKIDFQADVQFSRLSPTVENAVYRIVQESLNNVRKHSGADQAFVSLTEKHDGLQIVVEDAGKGFDPKVISEKRYGLAGIRDRARLLGGDARIESQPGAGARITVRLPSFDVHEPETSLSRGDNPCDA